MTVAPLVYLVPLPLAYLLFVGISGRLDPLSRPERSADRPWWLLGLWVAVTVALVLLASLIAVDGQPPERARALLGPSAVALASLMLPGLVLWQVCRSGVARSSGKLSADDRDSRRAGGSGPTGSPAFRGHDLTVEDLPELSRESAPPVVAFLSRLAPGTVDVPDIPVAAAEQGKLDEGTEERGAGVPLALRNGIRGDDPFALALRGERRLRAETEKHLRVIRRVLGVLAEGSDDREQVDVLVSLEAELESRIRESVTTEATLCREAALRADLEDELAWPKRDRLSARHAVRRGAEAHERANEAAARSLKLARQALRTRAHIEERLRESEKMLAARQATIGSLVSALEQARGRSRHVELTTGTTLAVSRKDSGLSARLARKASRVRPLTSRG